MSITSLFLANWKMNKLLGESKEFAEQFVKDFSPHPSGIADVGIAPPLTALSLLNEALGSVQGISLGAQNVHWLESGAHTGEVSAAMLKELGASFALCGHSERRQFYGETSQNVARRAKAAIENGLQAVVCIGETREDFEAGLTADVVHQMLESSTSSLTAEHLSSLVIAYEPVWAIGTGLAATPEIAAKVHDQIRQELTSEFGAEANSVPILYGGSIKPENIAELIAQENINGGLIGGASLSAESFSQIIKIGRA